MLHNLWNLSPFVPAFSIGQNALADENFERYPVDALMAGSLLSHITFFSDLRKSPGPRGGCAWRRGRRSTARTAISSTASCTRCWPIRWRGGWTALQSWDADAGEGALLAFRQQSEQATRRIALTNVGDGTYELISAPDGACGADGNGRRAARRDRRDDRRARRRIGSPDPPALSSRGTISRASARSCSRSASAGCSSR